MDERKLSPALEGKYRLIGYAPGEIEVTGFGTVDFRTASLATVDRLYARHKPAFLEKIEAPADAKASAKS